MLILIEFKKTIIFSKCLFFEEIILILSHFSHCIFIMEIAYS